MTQCATILRHREIVSRKNRYGEKVSFTLTLNARARNTFKAAKSAQIALNAAIGQEIMEGWCDGKS